MGNIVGGITNALFGKGGAGTAEEAVRRARELGKDAVFKGWTTTTSTGGATYDPATGQYSTTLNQPYQDILGTSLAGAGSLYDQLARFNPEARAGEIFQTQSALLQPQFQQQAIDLQNRLFGSGRLGLRLAGESQGLGTGAGGVQPDALGLGTRQQQTLAQLAADSRTQALSEAQSLGQLAGGMLQSGMGISEMERALLAQGVDAETARAAAAYASGTMQLDPYKTQAQIQQDQRGQNAGFFGSVLGGAMSGGLFSGGSTSAATQKGLNIARTDRYKFGGTFGD